MSFDLTKVDCYLANFITDVLGHDLRVLINASGH